MANEYGVVALIISVISLMVSLVSVRHSRISASAAVEANALQAMAIEEAKRA